MVPFPEMAPLAPFTLGATMFSSPVTVMMPEFLISAPSATLRVPETR